MNTPGYFVRELFAQRMGKVGRWGLISGYPSNREEVLGTNSSLRAWGITGQTGFQLLVLLSLGLGSALWDAPS